MKAAPIPPTPNLMALLCMIGGAMRGEGPVDLGLQLLLIGTQIPQFGWLLKTWLRMEEYHAAGHVWAGEWSAEDDAQDDPNLNHYGDGDGHAGDGRLHSGWVRQEGQTWLWRHVTKVCTVIVPIRWFSAYRIAEFLPRAPVWAAGWSLPAPSQNLFFPLALAARSTCVLFVTI